MTFKEMLGAVNRIFYERSHTLQASKAYPGIIKATTLCTIAEGVLICSRMPWGPTASTQVKDNHGIICPSETRDIKEDRFERPSSTDSDRNLAAEQGAPYFP